MRLHRPSKLIFCMKSAPQTFTCCLFFLYSLSFGQRTISSKTTPEEEEVVPVLVSDEREIILESTEYCLEIKTDRDKFTGKVSHYSSPLPNYNMTAHKDVSPGESPLYLLGLFATSNRAIANRKGVIVLLENGAKITKPDEDIDIEVNKYKTHGYGDFEYSAYISLTKEDRALLIRYRITDIRLYVVDKQIGNSEGVRIQEHVKCLMGR